MLENIPRERFAFLPTPLHRMKNLGESIGIENLWVKRDDFTGPAIGGNKIRKLEFVLGDAIEKGCDTVITAGAIQSNHCRQTASAAAKLGLRCILLLSGEEPEVDTGNLLLDKLYGAEIKYFPDIKDIFQLNQSINDVMETLIEFGLTPYAIPVGAAVPLGCVAFASATLELKEQCDIQKFNPNIIISAVGTGSSLAGLALGVRALEMDTELIGVSVISKKNELRNRVNEYIKQTEQAYSQLSKGKLPRIDIIDEFLPETYGVLDSSGRSAIETFAKMEGILLDPVYTCRAGLALMRMGMMGGVQPDSSVVFWHTGGLPTLFNEDNTFFTD